MSFFSASLILIVPLSILAEGIVNSLPPGEGREETFVYCISCHSTKIIEQQGLTEEDWKETLDWMIEEQGMPELEINVQDKILKYLITNFPPERPFYSPR